MSKPIMPAQLAKIAENEGSNSSIFSAIFLCWSYIKRRTNSSVKIQIDGTLDNWENILFYLDIQEEFCLRIHNGEAVNLCVLSSIDTEEECRAIFAAVPLNNETNKLGIPFAIPELFIYADSIIAHCLDLGCVTEEEAHLAVSNAIGHARENGAEVPQNIYLS